MKKIFAAVTSIFVLAGGANAAVVVLSAGTYTENFNAIGTTAPAGWSVYTGATASSIGTSTTIPTAVVSWADTTGGFRNVASTTGLSSSSAAGTQSSAANRALGIKQSGSFGDAGASFDFNFNTSGLNVSSFNLDALMLTVDTRSTTWTIQYGLGASPTTWNTLTTYSDPGAWGSTGVSVTSGLSALSNQSNAWIRIVALTASSGSGSRDTFAIDNFSIITTAIVAVPEPSSLALVSLGAAFLIYRRRQKA